MAASRSISTGALIPRERPHERHDGYTHKDATSEHPGAVCWCSFRVGSGLMDSPCRGHTQSEQLIGPHRLCQGFDGGPSSISFIPASRWWSRASTAWGARCVISSSLSRPSRTRARWFSVLREVACGPHAGEPRARPKAGFCRVAETVPLSSGGNASHRRDEGDGYDAGCDQHPNCVWVGESLPNEHGEKGDLGGCGDEEREVVP